MLTRLILIIKENWEDPVWSKVIAGAILAIATLIVTSVYSLFRILFTSASFWDSLDEVAIFLNSEISLKVWLGILLTFIYLSLVSNKILSWCKNFYLKLTNSQPDINERKDQELPPARGTSTVFFNGRMSNAFPGIRKLTWFKNPKDATHRLEILLQNPLMFKDNSGEFETRPIWYFRGGKSSFITKFKKIGSRKILLNRKELKIKRIAAYHGDSYYKDFVYVEAEGEKQTGLYNYEEGHIKRIIKDIGYCSEEYGVIENWIGWKTLMKREEYDDGATVVRGKVRDALDAELRVRYISDYNFIIAAKGSPYNSLKFDSESRQYFDRILTRDVNPEDFFDFLKSFKKNEGRINI